MKNLNKEFKETPYLDKDLIKLFEATRKNALATLDKFKKDLLTSIEKTAKNMDSDDKLHAAYSEITKLGVIKLIEQQIRNGDKLNVEKESTPKPKPIVLGK